ncbi:MAG: glycoside hydrolase family 2 TIM barrel-domain containing protein, partial [Chthoniobacterales bacterium]
MNPTPPRLNTLVLLCTLIALTFGKGAHGEMTSRPEWEDEQINSVGNEPARATSVPSKSLESALNVPTADGTSPSVQSLNGTWKFNWVPKPEERPVEFYQPDFDVDGWAEISVPSNLEIEGYGPPIYLTSDYAFKNSYPEPIVTAEPPKEYTTFEQRNAVGSYRREFTVSDAWKDKEIYLHFAGGGAAYYVWINGEKVGYFEDTFSPSEFRVTDLVKFGQPNILAVELYRWSDGSYLEDQDFFRLSGLFRDVFLWSCDPAHVRDFFITTDLDSDFRDASLDAEVSVQNLSATDRDLQVRVQLFDADGSQIASDQTSVKIPSGEDRRIELSQAVSNPEKWSAESPYLYTTVVELLDEQNGDDVVIDRRSCKTGFREVSVSDKNELLINGKPVILKGVNRHGHDPETGHYERKELMLADVLLMKQNNVNCVRTAHYPNDPTFYRLLDEYGIYAIDEANLESHGLLGLKEESVSYNPKWEQAYLDRALTMVERDKNHPSIIIWSMGNEGGGGQNYLRCSEETRKIDPTRLVFYDGFHDGHEGSDIDGSMYVPLPQLIERHGEPKKTRPYFHTEFGHSQGNSLGNLQEYV